jgi:hypothetical protein
MKKHAKLGIYHEVEQVSREEAKDFANIHGRNSPVIGTITDVDNVWRVKFFGPKIRTDAGTPPAPRKKKTKKKKLPAGLISASDYLTKVEADPRRAAALARARERGPFQDPFQQAYDEEKKYMGISSVSGNMSGVREYVVIKLYEGNTPTYVTPQVTRAEALHIARSAEAGCVALVAKTEQYYDHRKSRVQLAKERVYDILDNAPEKSGLVRPDRDDLDNLYEALAEWKAAINECSTAEGPKVKSPEEILKGGR